MLPTRKPIQSNPSGQSDMHNVQIQPIQPIQQIQPIQPIQPQVVNNFTIIDKSSESIIVEHNKEKNEFTFSKNTTPLGSFNVLQLFKYLNSDIDNYLVSVNIGTSTDIISQYIYSKEKDTEKNYELISYLESPFTGNIELIVKLYSDIIKL